MITQSFNILNGEYVQTISGWIIKNGGEIESIKISHPVGNDPFYGDLSIISEIECSLSLGGLAGTVTFKFIDDKNLKISFYGSLPMKSGCYREAEIGLRNEDSFDFAIDTLADEIKDYLADNSKEEEAESEDVSDEPF